MTGVDAEVVVSALPISTQHTPRCWVISNDGSLIAIGYEEGMIQVPSNKPCPLVTSVCVGVVTGTRCNRCVGGCGGVEKV